MTDQEEETSTPKVYQVVKYTAKDSEGPEDALRKLEEKANKEVIKGWVPVGFHSIERGPNPSYYQPMVRAAFLEDGMTFDGEGSGTRILDESIPRQDVR